MVDQTDKFNDRKRDYYRYNVFYNKLVSTIKEDYNRKRKPLVDHKALLHKHKASEIV